MRWRLAKATIMACPNLIPTTKAVDAQSIGGLSSETVEIMRPGMLARIN
jgi:hypothetical protein